MTENRFCKNCRFFLELPNSETIGHGLCRESPPTVIMSKDPNSGEDRLNSHFPIMPVSGWCGKFAVGKGPSFDAAQTAHQTIVNNGQNLEQV